MLDCDYVAKGMTQEELWNDATNHVIRVHGMKIEDISLQYKASHKLYIIES